MNQARPRFTPELLDEAPPHSQEAEAGVIGSILLDAITLDTVGPMVTANDFHDQRNATLYSHLVAMRNGGDGAIDAVLLKSRLKETGDYEKAGGTEHIVSVADSVAVAAHAKHYAKIVLDMAAKRLARLTAEELIRNVQCGQMTATDALQRARIGLEQAVNTTDDCDCQSKAQTGRPVVLQCSDVQPEPIEWLWPGRFALGKLSLIAGDPGLGKSLISLDMAARLSTGYSWPDTSEPVVPGSVVMLSAEDDPADTIRPRLDAAGADPSKIHLLTAVGTIDESNGKRTERTFSLERDITALDQVVGSIPDCRLVVIDPISAYLGKTDSHKNSDIRGLLAPLAALAQKHRIAVLVVTHLNKSSGPAMYRSMGSLAFVAAARMVWAVVKDNEDPTTRLVLPIKCNIAPDVSGLRYSVVDNEGAPCVAWSADPVNVDVDEIMAAGADREAQTERDEAKDFLRTVLADGPVASKDIKAEASSNGGPSWATIRRAQGDLGITPYREGFGKGATWMWALTEDPPEVQRCSPDPIDAQSKDVSTFDDREHLCTDGGCGDWADENIDLAADAGEEFDFGGPA